MSIIQDALKKAQGDYVQKPAQTQPENRPDRPAPAQHHEHRRHASMRLPALVSVLAIVLLAYGFRLSMQYSKTHGNTVVETSIPSGKAALSNPGKLNPMSFMDPRRSLFILSGIMYVENKPQAIINGQVLEEGDKIGGATILMIEKDCVLLDINDANIRLQMNKD